MKSHKIRISSSRNAVFFLVVPTRMENWKQQKNSPPPNFAGFSQAADNTDMTDLGSIPPPPPLFLTYEALGKQDKPEEQSLHRAEISQTSWPWQLGQPGLMLYWWMFPLHWYKASSPQTMTTPHSLYLEFQMLRGIISFRFWSVYLMAVSESVCVITAQ